MENKLRMRLNLNWKITVAFILLMFLLHETHEIVHTTIGRAICGCWGFRDFNVWNLCEGCIEQKPYAIIATFAGPIYTFALVWLGYWWLTKSTSQTKKSFGLALIFGNMPFARILGALLGGGDEVFGLKNILLNPSLAWALGLVFVLLCSIPPLVVAFRTIGNKNRWWWFLGFLILPFVIDLIVVVGILNTVMNAGVLSQTWILGSPFLVTVWTLLVAIMFLLFKKHIGKILNY